MFEDIEDNIQKMKMWNNLSKNRSAHERKKKT